MKLRKRHIASVDSGIRIFNTEPEMAEHARGPAETSKRIGTVSLVEASINNREPLANRSYEDIIAERSLRIEDIGRLVSRVAEIDEFLGRPPFDLLPNTSTDFPPIIEMSGTEINLALQAGAEYIRKREIRMAALQLAEQKKQPGE